MSKFISLPILILFLSALSLKAQYCLNGSDNPDFRTLLGIDERGVSSICDAPTCTGALVNVKFHVLHMDNGTGGYSESDVSSCKSLLDAAYNPQGISFNYLTTHHWNKSFYLTTSSLAILSIFTDVDNQRTSDAIHIYLILNPQLGAGKADGIPSNACFMGGSATYNGITYQLVPSHVVSHEVGHCMGLQHTFNNYTPGTPVTEANPCTMGDFVADTPVDPVTTKECILGSSCTFQNYNGNCPTTDSNGNPYTPDLHNYMAYTVTTCMNHFTAGQGDKMREDAMIGIPGVFQLSNITSVPNQSTICANSSQTLSVCFPGTVTWSCIPAGAVVFSNPTSGNLSITITPAAGFTGTVTIKATATNGTFKQITRTVSPSGTINGTYSNNGGANQTMYTVNSVKAGSVFVMLSGGGLTNAVFTWTVQSGSAGNLIISPSGNTASFTLNSGGSVTFYITAPCALSRTVTFYVGGWGLAVWPNPTADLLHVQLNPPAGTDTEVSTDLIDLNSPEARSTAQTQGDELDVEIHDSFGILVYSGKMPQQEAASIDVSGLKNGIYWVSVRGAHRVNSSRVMISR